MRVLIVEDEDASLEETIAVLKDLDANAEVFVAGDQATALQLLNDTEFDLIVCDLKIPPAPNDLGADEAHGLAVHASAQEICPGTPLIFLTGRATPTNVQHQLSYGVVTDYYGLEATPLVQLAVKDGNRQEVEYIRDMVTGLESLDQCSVSCEPQGEASDLLLRAVRTYAKQLGALEVDLELLSGLSGAEVARAIFRIPNGQTRSILVKLQDREAARDERSRYDQNVPNKLRLGYFAPSAAAPIEHGLRKQAALFYTVAADTRSLFRLAADSPEKAADVVASMAVDHLPWTSEQHIVEVNLGDLRRRRLPDDDPRVQPLFNEPWRGEIEALDVSLHVSTTHGDLHGLNVLVDTAGRATLIDYGDVGVASTALDPLTLEMSVLFHKDGPQEAKRRSLEQLRAWSRVEEFADGSDYAPVFHQCRSWANRVTTAESLFATAYVHAVRQLKYRDVQPDDALAVAFSAGKALLDLGAQSD